MTMLHDAHDDAPDDAIAALETRMDALRDEVESCRKTIIVSRVAIGAGAVWLAAALLGLVWSKVGLLLAVAACLGGFVGLGSNATSQRQAREALAQCKAERDALIDSLDLRPL